MNFSILYYISSVGFFIALVVLWYMGDLVESHMDIIAWIGMWACQIIGRLEKIITKKERGSNGRG